MENTEEMNTMLSQLRDPAFIVQDGIITQCNAAAVQRQVPEGTDVRAILETGRAEYDDFSGGKLYLTLKVEDAPCSACVTKVGDRHLFVIEQEQDAAELQSMALTAQILRTPLSNVMTVADQLFPLSYFDNEPEAQEQIARINRGLYQMLRIVCNMSDAYRYSCESSPRTELIDITAFLRELICGNEELIGYAGIRLHYEGPAQSIYTLVDTEKLERAIGNMLSNAIKFTPRGGTIHIRLTRKDKMLYLTVQDSGEGIADAAKHQLYSRYQRMPGLEDSRFGVGLGILLICQTAAAHGGTVLMESGKDFGLKLTMSLPIRQPSDPGVRSPMIHVDYAGDRDHRLLELADCLPADAFRRENVN